MKKIDWKDVGKVGKEWEVYRLKVNGKVRLVLSCGGKRFEIVSESDIGMRELVKDV